MNTQTIYLAGPIDDITTEDALGWREELAAMAPTGCLLFNPVTAWRGVSQATASSVAYGDRVAISHSDGVIANLMGPGRAFGTIREIEFARSQGKPVVVVTELPITSCFAHDVYQECNLEDGLNRVIEAIRKHVFGLRLPIEGDDGEE